MLMCASLATTEDRPAVVLEHASALATAAVIFLNRVSRPSSGSAEAPASAVMVPVVLPAVMYRLPSPSLGVTWTKAPLSVPVVTLTASSRRS
jgi:hypothetical protein